MSLPGSRHNLPGSTISDIDAAGLACKRSAGIISVARSAGSASSVFFKKNRSTCSRSRSTRWTRTTHAFLGALNSFVSSPWTKSLGGADGKCNWVAIHEFIPRGEKGVNGHSDPFSKLLKKSLDCKTHHRHKRQSYRMAVQKSPFGLNLAGSCV